VRRFLEWFKKELRQYIGSAIFFAGAFCLIALANKLMVAGSNVQVATFARAIIGGLIVAKLLFFVDLIPGVDAFRGKPLIFNILWKIPIYMMISLVYRYLDPVIGFVVAGVSVAESHAHTIREFTHPAFWAIEVWLGALFVVFVMMRELTLALGKDKVRLLFFGR
jgi:uncharacterized membrane protein